MTVFRENTEDVYAGIEYQSGTPEAKKLIEFLADELGANVDITAGVGIKPITPAGSKRLVKEPLISPLRTTSLPSLWCTKATS